MQSFPSSVQNQENTIVRMSLGNLLKNTSNSNSSNHQQIEIKLPSSLFVGKSSVIDLDQLETSSTEKQRLKSIRDNLIDLIQNFM
jgi:hypothetical protein